MASERVSRFDGPGVCPFVAFEDDRDHRSAVPDHQHRCYAEVRPAPRALAHQEAYCLSTTFAVCPTFRDWAQREAAMATPGEEVVPEAPQLGAERPPSELDWTAPPPWLSQARGDAGATPAAGPERGAPEPLALFGETGEDGSEGFGEASSAGAAAGGGAEAAGGVEADWETPEDEDDVPLFLVGRRPRAAEDERFAPSLGAGRRSGRPVAGGRQATPLARPPMGLAGPPWERPHRYEAYPRLRLRVGLPSIPRVGIAAIALIVAAAALFLIPFSGFFAARPATPTPRPTPPPSASVAPGSGTPAGTLAIYIVKPGDTLSGIAEKLGVTLDQLLAANRQIADPDRIVVGDRINIPGTGPAPPAETPAPGGSPGTSTPLP